MVNRLANAPLGQCHLVKDFTIVATGLMNKTDQIFYHKIAPMGLESSVGTTLW